MNLPPMAKGLGVLFFLLLATAFVWAFDSPPRAQALGIPRDQRGVSSSILAPTGLLTVTTSADSGAGSLREAIGIASPGDTINFILTLPATITLSTGELSIAQDLTINGPGASLLAVSAGNFYRVFSIGSGNVTISALTIRNGNNTSDLLGGGIFNATAMTLTNCAVVNNMAGHGSGIYNLGTATVTNSLVMSNTGAIVGGGILNGIGAQLIIDRSTIMGNAANSAGIYSDGGFVTITNSTLSSNDGNISGIYIRNGSLAMSNSTLSGNTTGTAVVYLLGADVPTTASIVNSTLVSNTNAAFGLSQFGGATTTLSLKNTMFASNTVTNNFVILAISATVTSLGYNLSDGTIPNATTGDQQNVTNIRVGALANNGGATQTMALLPGSPAINAGDNSGCPATDQRGALRPRTVQNPCDIGAFENSYLFLPLILK